VSKGDCIEVEATVRELLPKSMFQVELTNGHALLAHASKRGVEGLITLLPGDKVMVELTPYDLSRGRIVLRRK
jgi:translation initiation factor IF-1